MLRHASTEVTPLDVDGLRRAAGAYRLSQAIYAFAELQVADGLLDGPRTASELAASRGLHERYLYRLLRALAGEGVLERLSDDRFQLTEASRLLAGRGGFRDMVVGWSVFPPTYAAFGELANAVRTGRKPFHLAHGLDFHTYMAAHPDAAATYDDAMESTVEAFEDTLRNYDFSRFRTVIDVGGGGGAFLAALLRAHPDTVGVCVDLPQVIGNARRRGVPPDVAGRLELVGADFFADPLPVGDAYTLLTVLRLFDDGEATALLARIRQAMPDTAVVVVEDFWLPEGNAPTPLGLADLQALCAYGGRDRSKSEYATILRDAGLRLGRIREDEGETFAIFEALPA